MARLRDLPIVVRKNGLWRFLKTVSQEVLSDKLLTYASAVAYSWLFAIFPFFIFLLSLLPYLPNEWKSYMEQNIGPMLREHVPHAASNVIAAIENLINQPKGGLLSLGLLVTIWGASGGMAMTMSALDAAYDVEKPRPFYKQRPLAILLTVVVATLLISVFVLVPIGTLLSGLLMRYGNKWLGWDTADLWWIVLGFGIVRITAALLLLLLALAILHRFGTAAKTRFQLFSPGAIFTIIVWFVLGTAFRIYIDKFGKYDKTYGSVGGVAILLLFFYIDALVLLVGSEINAEINREVNPTREAGRDPQDDEPVPAT